MSVGNIARSNTVLVLLEMVLGSLERAPPYNTRRTTSIRVIDAQFKKLPLQRAFGSAPMPVLAEQS
jgi:hypothetical protein